MNFYKKLPTDLLLSFYYEIAMNIKKGTLTKNMYYELGLIMSVASQRGIILRKPHDFEQIVNQKSLDHFCLLFG